MRQEGMCERTPCRSRISLSNNCIRSRGDHIVPNMNDAFPHLKKKPEVSHFVHFAITISDYADKEREWTF